MTRSSSPQAGIQTGVLVIGAGQAGLATGFHLKQVGIPHLILEAAPRIGDSWRNRYDSLTLFTPRAYSQLPGCALPGDQHGYPSRDEFADYLEEFAKAKGLPVRLNAKVERLEKEDRFAATPRTVRALSPIR
jgi:putative flavoprotein involved in K+ transport